FSGALGQYPWPQVSAVEGLIEGMEYPMVIYCPSLQKREDQYWVLMHELGHQWFPMQVGSDERRYPWMDEGFNTFADYDAPDAISIGSGAAGSTRPHGWIRPWTPCEPGTTRLSCIYRIEPRWSCP